MSDKRKIILDTDPGIDDAVAIALAAFSEVIDIKLITTVSGNVHIDHVTENVLKLLTFYGKISLWQKGPIRLLSGNREMAVVFTVRQEWLAMTSNQEINHY